MASRTYGTARCRDCGTLITLRAVNQVVCAQCRARKGRKSGKATKHGAAHNRAKRRWSRIVNAAWARGEDVLCVRCGKPLPVGKSWDLGHVDGTVDQYQGPEHPRCSRRAGAELRNRKRRFLAL